MKNELVKRTHKSEIEAIRKLVICLKGQCYVLHQSGRLHGSAGLPDLYIRMPGDVFWQEVKVGGGKLTPAQLEFRENSPLEVLVGGVEETIRWLTRLGYLAAIGRRMLTREQRQKLSSIVG